MEVRLARGGVLEDDGWGADAGQQKSVPLPAATATTATAGTREQRGRNHEGHLESRVWTSGHVSATRAAGAGNDVPPPRNTPPRRWRYSPNLCRGETPSEVLGFDRLHDSCLRVSHHPLALVRAPDTTHGGEESLGLGEGVELEVAP